MRNYRCLTGKDSSLDFHLLTAYHQRACPSVCRQLRRKQGDSRQLNNEKRRQLEEQRNRLVPIIKTVVLCGRLGIAFRGHRDDGWRDVSKPVSAAQAFRVDVGDAVRKRHLDTAAKNATYISKTIQNELI